MYEIVAFLTGAVLGGIVMFFVGNRHGQRFMSAAGKLKDTVGKF
jgi:membrane protein DedA with SNARE-associated domain